MRSRFIAVVCVLVLGCGTAATPAPSGISQPGALPTRSAPPIDLAGVPPKVHVEASKATATWIGPEGGTLSAMADGTAYELEIPAYAVKDPTAITMTPITAVDELGLSGGLAGAVFLQPAGLSLAVPATLRITTSRAAPAGTRLVGFDVPDDGAPTDLVPASGAGTVSVAVFHFSSPGAGYGTTQDLAQLSAPALSTRMAGVLSTLLAHPVPWDSTTKAIAGTLIDTVWTQAVRPAIVDSGDDTAATAGAPVGTDAPADAALLRAIRDWRTFVFVLNLWAASGDVAAALAAGESYAGGFRASHTAAYLDGQSVLDQEIRQAVDGNKALCNQDHDLNALANVWFWAGLGERYAPDVTDWPAQARGCAEIVVATFNPPTNLQAGGSDSLQLVFNLEFADATRVPADVEATLHGTGFTFASSGTADMTAGVAGGTTLTAGVSASQGPPWTLSTSACWHLDGLERNLCTTMDPLTFGDGPTSAPTQPGATGGSDALAQELAGTYALRLMCEDVVFGTGTATATASGGSVSITWSVTTSDPGSGGLCHDALITNRFPVSGTYAGPVEEISGRILEIAVSAWQVSPCLHPEEPPTRAAYDRALRSIGVPLGRCVSLSGISVSGTKT